MNIITGYTGTPHITSAQDRAAHQGIIGEGSYILNVGNKLAAEVISANEVRIRDGVLSHQGCFGIIEPGTYDTLTIANGSQGMLRHDLIVCRYEKNTGTNVESLSLVVVQGTPSASNPADPTYNTGNIQIGDSPVDFPLYRVNIDGITIDSVDTLAAEAGAIAEHQVELEMMKLRGHTHIASDTASSTANAYKELISIEIPANNTGYDIVYRVEATCMAEWVAEAYNQTVGLSIWANNGYGTTDNLNRNVISMFTTWNFGLKSVAYILVPNGSAARTVWSMLRHGVANAPLSDISLSYEAFTWEKAA